MVLSVDVVAAIADVVAANVDVVDTIVDVVAAAATMMFRMLFLVDYLVLFYLKYVYICVSASC